MPASISVVNTNNKKDALDMLVQGIQVANGLLSGYQNVQEIGGNASKNETAAAEAAKATRQNKQRYTLLELEHMGLKATPIAVQPPAPTVAEDQSSPIVSGAPSVPAGNVVAQSGANADSSPLAKLPKGKAPDAYVIQPDGTEYPVTLESRKVAEDLANQSYREQTLALAKESHKLSAAEHATAADQKKQDKLNVNIEHLSKRIDSSGLADLNDAATRLQSSLKLSDPKFDIPGFGQTYLLPDAAVTNEGRAARQDVAQLRNVILKARSGGAVTPSEAERMLQEIGEGAGRNDAQLRRGVINALTLLKSKSRNITAGYQPDVIEQYKKQGGRIPLEDFSLSIDEPSKAKTVIQNGHTYQLNEKTGKYE